MVYKKPINKDYLEQFIPESFDYLTKTKKIEYNGQNLKTDYIINIINELLLKFYFHKDDTIEKEIRFNLWSKLLRDKYGHLYNYYIQYLLDKEFIFMVSDYCGGVKARTYRLNSKYTKYIRRIRIFDKVLLKKHSKSYLKKSYLNYNNSPIPMDVREKLADDLYDITIDYEKSMEYLNNLRSEKEISYIKYMKNSMSLESLRDGNIFFKFDEYGRMHTNYTILKRNIRKNFLSIDGQPLHEIDLKNSQPLFLAVLMKRELSPNKLINSEITRYFDLVNNGLIYEELMNKCSIKDREEAKIMMYKVLFGVNGDTRKYNKMFNSVFPHIYAFILKYKKEKKNYKSLSYALQNLESEFIFNKVIKHLMVSNPEIKLFTVHDSLCFPLNHKETVTTIFDYYKRNLLS